MSNCKYFFFAQKSLTNIFIKFLVSFVNVIDLIPKVQYLTLSHCFKSQQYTAATFVFLVISAFGIHIIQYILFPFSIYWQTLNSILSPLSQFVRWMKMEHLETKMTLISAGNKIQEHVIKIREGGQRKQFPFLLFIGFWLMS